MTNIEYIRSFLHDPHGDRWTDSTIQHHIDRAVEHLGDLADVFLKTREINRKKSALSNRTLVDKTAIVQLVDGKSTYKIDDDELVAIKSLVYDNRFVDHINIDDDCPDGVKLVRSYSSAGLPKGVFKLVPTPSSSPKIYDAFKCNADDMTCEQGGESDNCCPATEIVRHIDDYYLYGWAFDEDITPWVEKVKVEVSDDENIDDDTVPVDLKPIEVIYQVKEVIEFQDNDDEVKSDLVDDIECIKMHACGQLLRYDMDSLSKTLGNEELAMFEKRTQVILAKYQELYETDDVVELEMQDLGNVSKVVSVSKLVEANDSGADAKAKANKVSAMIADEKIGVYEDRKACRNKYDSLPSKTI